MKEIWKETFNTAQKHNTIVAVSNMGRIKRKNGTIEFSKYRQEFYVNKIKTRIYRFIAEQFIPKTQEDIEFGRDEVDHKTHEPDNMNINDVRNLRWCTHKENMGFEEARTNISNSNLGTEKECTPHTEFGIKYREHFGMRWKDNPKQYQDEHNYYKRHNNKFSWE